MTDTEHQRELVSLFMRQRAVHLLDWVPVKDKSGNRDRFFFPNAMCIHESELSACSICRSGRSPGSSWRKKCNPSQYFCLENPMDRGAWWATVHGVGKSRTRLSVSIYHVGIVFILVVLINAHNHLEF